MKFTEIDFAPEVLDGLSSMRFDTATPVQEKTIPIIMEGHDLIGCAQTGTGKTAAYLLPVLDRLVKEKPKGVSTIILVPTRELALQIDQQMEGFSYFLPVTSTPVYGGNDKELWEQQRKALTDGCDMIVATPGRLIQHLQMGYVKFDQVKHFILDEADRMLDMGFFEDIMKIVSHIPKERQTLLFSATMPPKIRTLAKNILVDPQEVNIAISKPAEGILQAAYVLHDYQKVDLLSGLLEGKDLDSIIIFSSRKVKVKEIVKNLIAKGFAARGIHSDLEQAEREEVLRLFKNRSFQILVATDIIARGIDIEKIDLVINFDVPRDAEDYVHRIGRTARAKTQGVGLTLVNAEERIDFYKIEQLIETTVYKVPLPPDFEEGPVYNPEEFARKKKRKNFSGNKSKGGKKFYKKRKPGADKK